MNNISAHIQKNRGVFLFIYFFCCSQVQLTDFENAAYVVFVVLLTRVILSYKLDFLIPLSKVKKKKNSHSVSIRLITIILSLCKQQQKSKEFPIYIPTVHLKVDENMKVAQKRNAVQEGMFYFRKDIYKGW